MQRAGLVDAEFELGVGNDNAAALGVGGGFFVQAQGGDAGFVGQASTVFAGAGEGVGEIGSAVGLGGGEGDVFVMVADGGLGGRGEDRGGQLGGHLEAGRQGDAADGAGLLVVLPAGTDHVAANHGFDR